MNIPTLVEDETRNGILYPFIRNSPDNFIFVETGSYLGGNIIRCALYAKSIQKPGKFYSIDNVDKTDVHESVAPYIDANKTISENFSKFIEDAGVEDVLQQINASSLDAYSLFEDNSIHVLFIDDNHDYYHLKKEIPLWIDKVTRPGIIAFHDATDPWVIQAINEEIGYVTHLAGSCWKIL